MQLIKQDAPAFMGSDKATAGISLATPSSADHSRSAVAFRLAAASRRRGSTFDQMCDELAADESTQQWFTEKGQANGGRELSRLWEKTSLAVGDLVLSPNAPLVSARTYVERNHIQDGARTLHHQNGDFYLWRGSHYAARPPEEMRAALYGFLETAKRADDTGKLVPFNPNKTKVANVQEALAAAAQLAGDQRAPSWLIEGMPDARDIIACANGLLHLPTMQLLPLNPSFFSLNALDFPFDPAAPRPAAFLDFLGTIWPDDKQAIETLQELFGLLLTPNTRYQKLFLIVGPKRSGKGTIARIATRLLGAANVTSPTLSSLASNFGMQPLIGKRLGIVSDARLSGKADQAIITERLLSITGEDSVTIDRKNHSHWTGKLDTRFLLLTNELPKLTDSSGALASRFVILRMVESFYGREDLDLTEKLTLELPGILLWALDGLRRLTARGRFNMPDSSRAAMEELENLSSPIGAFLKARCEIGAGLAVQIPLLFDSWRDWCQQQGRDHPGTAPSFGRDLGAYIPGLEVEQHRDGTSRARYYVGVTLLSPDHWTDGKPEVARCDTRVSTSCPQLYDHDDPGPL